MKIQLSACHIQSLGTHNDVQVHD